jgi:peptide deformylase
MTKIVQKEHKVLREIAKAVDLKIVGTAKFKKMLDEMTVALNKEKDGVALAAPQIGESLRLFIISPLAYEAVSFHGERRLVFINPVITKRSRDKKLMEEGCLSVRPLYGKVRRSSRVALEAYDEKGEKFKMEVSGLIAQIFQHETDHLDGTLFIDKAKDIIEMPKELYER